ncbi:MAG: hypothetical protein KKD17_02980 [Nanoarchaeota archaeon]|nr:hypothetical protein [Nanoarchaeota archaeon]
MYEQTENPLETIGKHGRGRFTNIATAVITAAAPIFFDASASYAGEAGQAKPAAPLEERLDSIPQQPLPILKEEYTPRIPNPLTIERMIVPTIPVTDDHFNPEGRMYQGKIRIGDEEYKLKIIIGLLEADRHKIILESQDGIIVNATEFKDGSEVYIAGNKGVSFFKLPEGEYYAIFHFSAPADNGKLMDTRRRMGAPHAVYLTPGVHIRDFVREGENLTGAYLIGDQLVCSGLDECFIVNPLPIDRAASLQDKQLEDRVSKVRHEVKGMIKAGSSEKSVLDYLEKAKRFLASEMAADYDNIGDNMEDFGLVPLVPPMEHAEKLLKPVVMLVEDAYAKPILIDETPAPKEVPVDTVVRIAKPVADAKPVQDYTPVQVPKPVEVPKPVKVPGPVAVLPPVEIKPALEFSQKREQIQDDRDRWYNQWWVWTIAGAAATGLAVGLGVGLTQGNGGGPTQPPVGTPTMDPWDNHDPAN